MNQLDGKILDTKGFAYRDILGLDQWSSFPVVFGSLTIVGVPSYTGRYRVVGKQCQFQVQFSGSTSIASAAGTDYLNLPITPAKGLAGEATMTDDTMNVAVGVCHIDVALSRCYLPAQAASGNVFNICGSYEIG